MELISAFRSLLLSTENGIRAKLTAPGCDARLERQWRLARDIVWTHRPFPCGSCADLIIFHMGMLSAMSEGERIVADALYRNEECFLDPDRAMIGELRRRMRAQYESVNSRLKQFAAMGSAFRRSISLHSVCFHAAINLTQLMLRNGNPLLAL